VLSLKNLTKIYPEDSRALRGFSREIPSRMFGLGGPNGAGKSTVNQKDETRRMLGYLPQESRPLEFVVDTKPTLVGIDPYNKLIDRNPDDNLIAVEEKK
jgi:energy-coupling factor transporter ATP-binding protein EcfA2